jgi:hypothetical protein
MKMLLIFQCNSGGFTTKSGEKERRKDILFFLLNEFTGLFYAIWTIQAI